jgi:hypothetical protein
VKCVYRKPTLTENGKLVVETAKDKWIGLENMFLKNIGAGDIGFYL